MSNTILWGILSAVVAGFVIKQVLEWLNQGRYKQMVDVAVAVSVFIAVSSLIIQGINAAIQVINTIPK